MLPLNASHFTPKNPKDQCLGKLTDAKIQFLEQSTTFTLREKIELLMVLTHTSWVTDLDVRHDRLDHNKAYVDALTRLELPWKTEHYVKRDGTSVYWMQVGANEAILDYLEQNRERLSVLEAGVFYGYPPTAVLGCVNILESKYKPVGEKSVAEFYLAGVFSADFIDQEVSYAVQMWSRLAKMSPKIVAEAESYRQERLKELESRK